MFRFHAKRHSKLVEPKTHIDLDALCKKLEADRGRQAPRRSVPALPRIHEVRVVRPPVLHPVLTSAQAAILASIEETLTQADIG